MTTVCSLAVQIEQRLLARDSVVEAFFAEQAGALSIACREMSERFLRGGRLLAFGRGPFATDAQHVSVEFVHPVIVGKRALPALDLSLCFGPWLEALLKPDDMVMGFAAPAGDPEVDNALNLARERQAMTFALPGVQGSYAMRTCTNDPFFHQEIVEILYHTLWETVHVFFEHRELGHNVGEAEFLYPFLGCEKQETSGIIAQVSDSIRMKANDDTRLRLQVAKTESERISGAVLAIRERLLAGGKLMIFGNGGSATDANDFAIDCVAPPSGYAPIPAVSLSSEPANITAIANDVGTDLIFLRQLVAHAKPQDVVIAISTSGGSRNLLVALGEAKKLGLLSVALLGYDGGEIKRQNLADFPIVVEADYIPRIQEVQASIYHTMREALEMVRQDG
jgi:D-sedoheptulose 7-phosphate isomerase